MSRFCRDNRPEPTSSSEAGDTLIEVLLALVVLGLTSLALIIAFSTSISASAEHRQLTTANLMLNNFSQQALADIEANQDLFSCGSPIPADAVAPPTPSVLANYFNAELSNTTITPNPPVSTAPYSPTITSVQYWNGTSFGYTCYSNVAELITVSVTGGSSGETNQFVVNSPSSGSTFVGGTPTGLQFTTQPPLPATQVQSSGTSFVDNTGAPVNPVVEVLFGNSPNATDLSPINLSLIGTNGTPTADGSLAGCSSNDLNGVVTYSGCTINLAAGTQASQTYYFEITASLVGTTFTATSTDIGVKGSTSPYLSFTTQPKPGNSGAVMSTPPVLKAYLGNGSSDTSLSSITLTSSGSTSSAFQFSSCTGSTNGSTSTENSDGSVTVTGNNGVFTLYSQCRFAGQWYWDFNGPNAVATPYTITASASGVIPITSQPFQVQGYGSAASMKFALQPVGGIAASTSATKAILTPFQVAVVDSWGNVMSGGNSEATYSGTLTPSASGLSSCTQSTTQGVVQFSNCQMNLGNGLQLNVTASVGGVSPNPITSSPFNVTGPVSQLAWYTPSGLNPPSPQPVAGASGSVMTNQPVVAFEDANNNVATAATLAVSYTATWHDGVVNATNPNGTLTFCSNLPPTQGIVGAGNCTFVGLVGTNYTLTAATTNTTGTVFTSVPSDVFSPTGPGPASQLVFATPPGVEPVPAAAGSPLATEPVVVVEDSGGNLVSSSSVQVEMSSYLYDSGNPNNPTTPGGTLLTCSSLPPSGGAVTLDAVTGYVDVAGSCAFGGLVSTSYQLQVTAPGLTSAVSSPFSPTGPGPANQIGLSGCTSTVVMYTNCSLTATLQDVYGNPETAYSTGFTFSQTGGTAILSGLGTQSSVAGVSNATLSGNTVGNGVAVVQVQTGTFTTSVTLNVVKYSPSITVAPPGTTPTLSQSATFTATVTGAIGGATPTGTVTWAVSGSAGIKTCSSTTGLVAGSPTSNATATCVITGVLGGGYSVSATYVPGADLNYNAAGPLTAATMTVAKVTPTISVTPPVSTPTLGQSATFTATVTGVATGPTPTGTVTWAVSGSAGVTTCSSTTGLVPGSPTSNATATCVINNVRAGGYAVTATYAPGSDQNYNATSPSIAATTTVAKYTPTLSNVAPVITPTLGQSATFTATVTGPSGGATPTGTVSWTITAPSGGPSCVTSTLAPASPTNTANATCVINAVVTGTYTVVATYIPGSDQNYNAASPATSTATVTIIKYSPTISNAAPITTPSKGQNATFTATVSGPSLPAAGPAPTGTVSWTITAPSGSPTCAPSPLVAGSGATASATCVINNVVVGGYSVVATYIPGADPNYNAANPATSTASMTINNKLAQAVLGVVSTKISQSSYGNPYSVTLGSTGGSGTGAVTYGVMSGATCSVSGATLTVSSEGTCTIQVSKAADGTYNSALSAVTTIAIGSSANNSIPASGGTNYYTINSATGGLSSPTANGYSLVNPSTVTSLSFSLGSKNGNTPQTAEVGYFATASGTWTQFTTPFTCTIAKHATLCNFSGTGTIASGAQSVNIDARGAGSNTGFWAVTFTQP